MRLPILNSVRSSLAYYAGLVLSTLFIPAHCRADFLTVYGGPTYTPSIGGYLTPVLPLFPGAPLNSSGNAIGFVSKFDALDNTAGNRAVRWSASVAAVELGLLGTGTGGISDSYPFAISTAGSIAGAARKFVSSADRGLRAVRWAAGGATATELGNLGTDANGIAQDYGYAINDAGVIAGVADKYSGGSFLGMRAVRWAAGGTTATELGNLGTDASGLANSKAFVINSTGVIAGYAEKYVSNVFIGQRAVRWDPTGNAATELDNLGTNSSGLAYNQALAINDGGVVAGYADKYVSGQYRGYRAVRWNAGTTVATELGNLGTDSAGNTFSQADAINSAGTIVGFANKYVSGDFSGQRAVRWSATGTLANELGNLGADLNGVTQSEAYALNGIGSAVGCANAYNAQGVSMGQRAVLWRANGVAINLNSLIDPASGWTLTAARAVNDAGWIAGIGLFDPDGAGGQDVYSRMFLLQAPIAASLLGDFDRNRSVNALDMQAMLAALADLPNYQATYGLSNGDLLAIGDLNGDGKVTNADLQGLIGLLSFRKWKPRRCARTEQ